MDCTLYGLYPYMGMMKSKITKALNKISFRFPTTPFLTRWNSNTLKCSFREIMKITEFEIMQTREYKQGQMELYYIYTIYIIYV